MLDNSDIAPNFRPSAFPAVSTSVRIAVRRNNPVNFLASSEIAFRWVSPDTPKYGCIKALKQEGKKDNFYVAVFLLQCEGNLSIPTSYHWICNDPLLTYLSDRGKPSRGSVTNGFQRTLY